MHGSGFLDKALLNNSLRRNVKYYFKKRVREQRRGRREGSNTLNFWKASKSCGKAITFTIILLTMRKLVCVRCSGSPRSEGARSGKSRCHVPNIYTRKY